MSPDSPAMHAEQLHFPKQTCKEAWFAWLISAESSRTLSQDERNTDATSGMQNNSEYPKSNSDEANFPCIGPVTIPQSTSYRTSDLTPFRTLQRFPETPASSIVDHQFQYSNVRKVLSTPYCLGMRMSSVFNWRSKPTFHKHLKRSLPSVIGMWEGLCVSCLKWNGHRAILTQKKAGFPCSGWNAGSSFISQEEGLSEYPVETL